MPDNVDVLLNLIINAKGAPQLLAADQAAKQFFGRVAAGAVALKQSEARAASAALQFSKLADKFSAGKLAAGEFEIKSNSLQRSMSKIGPALHTSIYQLSALYYLLSNVANQLQRATEAALNYARELETLSAQTGLSIEKSAAFSLAAQNLSISTDTVQEAFRTFSDRLGRATGLFGEPTKGSKDMARAMKELGIDVFDAAGNVRGLEDLLPEIFSAFQKLGPGIKTTAVATALFGQRADEMIPLLIRGAQGIEDMEKKSVALGLALTQDEVTHLRNFNVALKDIELAGQSMFTVLAEGLSFLSPVITAFAVGGALSFKGLFVSAQAEILGFVTFYEQLLIHRSPVEIALERAQQAISDFAASVGFIEGEFGLVPDPNRPKTGIGFPPGLLTPEGEGDVEDPVEKAQKRANDKLRDLRLDFIADAIKDDRDFRIKQRKDEEDYLKDRSQSIEDFYRKMEQKGIEFDLQTLERVRDFNLKQQREFEDFDLERRRLLEDFDISQRQAQEKEAERRIELEDKTRKKLADLNAKWDEILLRLRIGGDVDSIRLAEQKRAEALSAAQTEENSELAKFEAESQRRRDIEREELEVRLRRLEEDFAIRQQRRQDDFDTNQADRRAKFELEQQEAISNFALELTRRDEEHRIKREREVAAFALEQADRFANYNAKREEIIREFEFEIGTRINYAQIREQIELESQRRVTENARQNVNERIELARYEREQLHSIYNEDGTTNERRQSRPKFAFGGTVPGELGAPISVLAHGGERFTPPATSTYFSNVRQGDQVNINAPVTFSNSVDSDAVAHRLSIRASRELGRTIAARRAFGG